MTAEQSIPQTNIVESHLLADWVRSLVLDEHNEPYILLQDIKQHLPFMPSADTFSLMTTLMFRTRAHGEVFGIRQMIAAATEVLFKRAAERLESQGKLGDSEADLDGILTLYDRTLRPVEKNAQIGTFEYGRIALAVTSRSLKDPFVYSPFIKAAEALQNDPNAARLLVQTLNTFVDRVTAANIAQELLKIGGVYHGSLPIIAELVAIVQSKDQRSRLFAAQSVVSTFSLDPVFAPKPPDELR